MLCMYVYYLMSLLLALVYTKLNASFLFPGLDNINTYINFTSASGMSIDGKKNGTIELYYWVELFIFIFYANCPIL